jgi:signal transduction histidine kinase
VNIAPYDGTGLDTISIAETGTLNLTTCLWASYTGADAIPKNLTDSVVNQLMWVSPIILGVFALIAVGAAAWLSGRSLKRVRQLTTATQDITANDLSRRLGIGGPKDEVRELGDTIDGMLERLQLAFARQRQFVANASHELRTPLATTRASLEIPLTQGLVPEGLRPDIERALAANERSEKTIAALLFLAGLDAEPETRQPLPLDETLAECLDAHAADAAIRGVALVPTEVEGTATANGDPELVKIAVDNLVSNAVRYSTPKASVTSRISGTETATVLEIENPGAELTEAEVADLTEPFNRGTASRVADDTHSLGLGLTLAQSIAKTQGGDLTLLPREGGGLIARLTLPSAEAEASPDTTPSETE